MKKILLTTVFTFLTFAAQTNALAEIVAPYTFSNAIIREAPAKIAAGYVTITNATDKSDTLIAAQASWADHIELHKITSDDHGVVKMSPIKEIALNAGSKAELKQGGYHLMIFGVKEKLSIDQKKDITLKFKNAGEMTVPFTIQPIGNMGVQAHSEHDHMQGM